MKTRLNITIDESLLATIKAHAAHKHTSVSELVENYFRSITKPSKRKNIISLVEELSKPAIDTTADLKEQFYENQAKKYGR